MHSPGKGANKTHPECIASDLPQAGCETHLPRHENRGRSADWGGITARRRGWKNVTAISSAEPTRRDFLYIATATAGAVGAAATLAPLVGQMNPDASTIAAGLPVEVDLSPIQSGQIIQVFWQSKPVFIFNRTPNEVKLAQDVDWQTLRDPAARFGARPSRPRTMAGCDRHLHASRLYSAAASGRFRRLVLPVPRLAIRLVRADPPRAGAAQSAAAALSIHLRQ